MLPLLYILIVSSMVALASVWLARDRNLPIAFGLALGGAMLGGVLGTIAGVALETVTPGHVSITTVTGALAALLGAVAASAAPSLTS